MVTNNSALSVRVLAEEPIDHSPRERFEHLWLHDDSGQLVALPKVLHANRYFVCPISNNNTTFDYSDRWRLLHAFKMLQSDPVTDRYMYRIGIEKLSLYTPLKQTLLRSQTEKLGGSWLVAGPPPHCFVQINIINSADNATLHGESPAYWRGLTYDFVIISDVQMDLFSRSVVDALRLDSLPIAHRPIYKLPVRFLEYCLDNNTVLMCVGRDEQFGVFNVVYSQVNHKLPIRDMLTHFGHRCILSSTYNRFCETLDNA